jgi:DNA mismatch repair protein MutL
MSRLEQPSSLPVRESVIIPGITKTVTVEPQVELPQAPSEIISTSVEGTPCQKSTPEPQVEETEQISLEMPQVPQWRMVGELYRSYILVEEGDDAFLIDKHAAHERILFDKLKGNQEAITSQLLMTPLPVRLSAEAAAELLSNAELLRELGFEIDEFGENTVLLRQIPMDLSPDGAAEAVESMAADLLNGRRERKETVRDEVLHTVACKAAIKAGWKSDEQELLAIVKEVMSREELKYCPHGRPICITLSKKQLEKQFKRS